jgi:hypothetical protein
MNLKKSSKKKYSASSMAAGAVFCPSCRKRISARDILVCPSCHFTGEDTIGLFPLNPPPLELLSDHAGLFSQADKRAILGGLRAIRRRFPQVHWRVATAKISPDQDPGLFSFWLFNVSPPGAGEDLAMRPWTVLLVILADGTVAVAPGYAAEVWLSGHDWSRLLRDLHERLIDRKFGFSIRKFFDHSGELLAQAWERASERTHKKAVTIRGRP